MLVGYVDPGLPSEDEGENDPKSKDVTMADANGDADPDFVVDKEDDGHDSSSEESSDSDESDKDLQTKLHDAIHCMRHYKEDNAYLKHRNEELRADVEDSNEREAAKTTALAEAEADLEKLIGRGASGEYRQSGEDRLAREKRQAALDMIKLVNKPSFFDGRNLVMRDWVIEMENYLEAVCWDPRQKLGVATQFLKGDAMKWWDLKKKQLHGQKKPLPDTWEEFKDLLATRWDNKNPELVARNKLEKLQQGNLTVHEYLKAFESCYAHIPEYLEADKIHKFLYGLNPNWRNRFQVNPTTHKRWDNFDALVAYITNYVADTMNAEAFESQATIIAKVKQHLRERKNGNGTRNGHNTNPRLSGVKRQREGGRGRGRGPPRMRFGNSANVKTYTNAAGQEYSRNDHVRSWLIRNDKCLCCYKETSDTAKHNGRTCTSTPRSDLPDGYEAPSDK